MEFNHERYCHDLPTKPIIENKILVTGATGYIGGELIPELQARGYKVRVLVRSILGEYQERWPNVEIAVGDVLNYPELKDALKGIQCAYYFIHSLHLGKKKFLELDKIAAKNFRQACDENGLKRIIYLGSLGDENKVLSAHLHSRIEVAKELQKGRTPVTSLRAAIIVGSGSASYKILKHIILKFPLILFPKKANSVCQPIAIKDVIKYLVGCLENPQTKGLTLDIGGPDILSYENILKTEAKVLKKKTLFVKSSIFSLKTHARFASLLIPVPYDLIKSLMKSCVNDAVCQDNTISEMIPFKTITFEEALNKTLLRESQKTLFEKKKKDFSLKAKKSKKLVPPRKSKGLLSDIKNFLWNKPNIPTLIKFSSFEERENYSYRILQRLGVKVSNYRILNVHKIGVNAPAKYIFEELLKWNGDSTCWPNHLARISLKNNRLETLYIYLFGWTKLPTWIKQSFLGKSFIPLFKLNAINFQKVPDPMGSDNARYLLYKSSGGYPIGVFTMYVRSSISEQNEDEQSQLFLMVGFNFYGKEKWSKRKFINRIWESIHDRVTSNVLNRLKQLSEWRFEKIKLGKG
jgi:uncharacterized protein YbjT (DUF2867 family)